MLEEVGFGLAAASLVGLASLIASWLTVPAPVVLVVFGGIYAVLPGPNIYLDPEVVLVLVIPPLLYSAALRASLVEIRANLSAIVSLSVGLVLVTALATAGLLSLLISGLGFAAACAMTAAIAPPDPVAAMSVGRRSGLPDRLSSVIEGEGLLNDATALTLYTIAVAASTGGGFSVGESFARFVLAAVGGAGFGLLIAAVIRLIRRRLEEPLVETTLSLATPFIAYLPAQAVHASGVLAVVVAGLWLGHESPVLLSGASRLHSRGVWGLVDFLLEGFVFLLIGQQEPSVLRGLRDYSAGTIATAAAVTLGSVWLIRALWLVPYPLYRRLTGAVENSLSRRELVVLWWAGMRGVISLAAMFALPLASTAHPFRYRDLLLFCAYTVVVVTLVGQGLTFGPLLRRLGVGLDPHDAARQVALARAAAADAGLGALDTLEEHESVPGDLDGRLREAAEARKRHSEDLLAVLEGDETEPDETATAGYGRIRRTMIEAEREELLRWRDAGRLAEPGLRRLERELDHEEGALPGHS